MNKNRSKIKKGMMAEDLAENYLKSKGMRIEGRNVRLKGGEIDIVARDGKALVFVEVRSTSERFLPSPLESITIRKQEKLKRSALYYLQKEGLDQDIMARFDVVSVVWKNGESPRIEWIRGAFEVSS